MVDARGLLHTPRPSAGSRPRSARFLARDPRHRFLRRGRAARARARNVVRTGSAKVRSLCLFANEAAASVNARLAVPVVSLQGLRPWRRCELFNSLQVVPAPTGWFPREHRDGCDGERGPDWRPTLAQAQSPASMRRRRVQRLRGVRLTPVGYRPLTKVNLGSMPATGRAHSQAYPPVLRPVGSPRQEPYARRPPGPAWLRTFPRTCLRRRGCFAL